jgi:hypothetical protein
MAQFLTRSRTAPRRQAPAAMLDGLTAACVGVRSLASTDRSSNTPLIPA